MPQFGASLIDDSIGVIYDCNMLVIQATGGSTTLTDVNLYNIDPGERLSPTRPNVYIRKVSLI